MCSNFTILIRQVPISYSPSWVIELEAKTISFPELVTLSPHFALNFYSYYVPVITQRETLVKPFHKCPTLQITCWMKP